MCVCFYGLTFFFLNQRRLKKNQLGKSYKVPTENLSCSKRSKSYLNDFIHSENV